MEQFWNHIIVFYLFRINFLANYGG